MGIRKNVKFLSAVERENFVKACVLMKADIVNPAATTANQYSKWDEYVAVHAMIQNAFAPGAGSVNFGHGGDGAYSFLSWHRYFLYRFEKDLQSHVPGVMLPYWDWTDPSSVMTDTFLGPNGTNLSGNVIQRGYFAFDKPGVGNNTTPLPPWWPASLVGWRLPSMFASIFQGGLRRRTRNVSELPLVGDLRTTLSRSTYQSFQNTLESGTGLASGNQMHNGLHGWIGGGTSTANGGHMNFPGVSPFDPFFYLHHCNIDRLWAMWQMDGHQTEYPTSGGVSQHHRNDIMYPWTGGTAGYGTSDPIAAVIPMPDFSALGVQRNVDTLDFRNAYGYTYDIIAIIGIGLDRTGSMNGLTPDPMVTSLPDVTKWEAAKRGVAAFLQDCETVQDSGAIYVMAGIKTFRSLGANQFDSVFGAPNYGLIKAGTAFSRATFDANINIATMSPGGGTPLADALQDIQNMLVEPPFGGIPADEQRYLAMLTDGMLTTGSPLNSIPDGSYSRTAIFTMGFGTGADVDYPTLAAMVAKGKVLTTQQVFHGENAGTIDKFYSNALASAIGFTSVFDPVVELFAGEHTHLDFTATSADDTFFVTAQGMDFQDKNWSFMLHGPNGQILYGNEFEHQHAGCHDCCQTPYITSRRSNGRLSLVIQRGSTDKKCWVGRWQLMISYKAKQLDKMLMPSIGELLVPVAAGAIRGERYSRLLIDQKLRKATRNIAKVRQHGLDTRAISTNSSNNDACNIVVNIYARTNLKLDVIFEKMIKPGAELKFVIKAHSPVGTLVKQKGFARMIAPAFDIAEILPREKAVEMIQVLEESKRYSAKMDTALVLAHFERAKKRIEFIKDSEAEILVHGDDPLHSHIKETRVPGIYHLGIFAEGLYLPNIPSTALSGHNHDVKLPGDDEEYEVFSRLLNISVAVVK
jgi:hypothetical protein